MSINCQNSRPSCEQLHIASKPQPSPMCGAVLIEVATSAVIMIFVVMGIIDISVLLHEANVVTEAARNGARSAAAASGRFPIVPADLNPSTESVNCSTATSSNFIMQAALESSCDYIAASHLVRSEWTSEATIGQVIVDGYHLATIQVKVTSLNSRGLVPWFKSLFNVRPASTSFFALEVLQ